MKKTRLEPDFNSLLAGGSNVGRLTLQLCTKPPCPPSYCLAGQRDFMRRCRRWCVDVRDGGLRHATVKGVVASRSCLTMPGRGELSH